MEENKIKPETRYRCEKCGTLYLNEADALDCEVNHRTPFKIIDATYDKNDLFPVTLTIEFYNALPQIYYKERRFGNGK